jgi:outer membrane translocation and assembly module TamA
MRGYLTLALLVISCWTLVAYSECAKDNRSDKHGGILVTDFIVVGTTTLTSNQLARVTGDFVGSCYSDDPEEMQERVRAAFQDRGYMAAEIKRLSLKPGDPLATPRPVTMDAEVVEGLRYKIGEITFLENRAFSGETLRDRFPLKKGETFDRERIAGGLESLRKLYGSNGFLGFFCVPESVPSSNGTITLNVKVMEGPQYRMGKLEIVGSQEAAAGLRSAWAIAEGATYDSSYLAKFVEQNRRLLPEGFTPRDARQVFSCPDALVEVSLIVDPRERTSEPPTKSIPCDPDPDKSK